MPTYTTHYNLAKPLVNSPVDEDLWGGELNDNMDIIDDELYALSTGTGGAYVPTGTILDYAGSSTPSGYLLCAGQAVSRSTYSDLFTAIGTTWGVGDGSTTFNVPDLRGRLGAGKDDMGGTSANRLTTAASGVDGASLAATGGSQTHTLTTAQLASHTHTGTTASDGAHTHTFALNYSPVDTASGTNVGTTSNNAGTLPGSTASNGAHTHTFTTAAAGSGDAHNNVQPTAIVLKIIKT